MLPGFIIFCDKGVRRQDSNQFLFVSPNVLDTPFSKASTRWGDPKRQHQSLRRKESLGYGNQTGLREPPSARWPRLTPSKLRVSSNTTSLVFHKSCSQPEGFPAGDWETDEDGTTLNVSCSQNLSLPTSWSLFQMLSFFPRYFSHILFGWCKTVHNYVISCFVPHLKNYPCLYIRL